MSQGGVLLIDKPIGPTSHDIVGQVRRLLATRRVGHAGTLDPMASGLLLLCIDGATRLLEYMTAEDKSYTGEVIFGIGTDTDDADGHVVTKASVDGVDDLAIQSVVSRLTGDIEQVVPQYSAVHINGKRAYELARSGETVEMPSKTVFIHKFVIGNFLREGDIAKAQFSVTCSKGTYIRALCRDLGQLLGVPAHMSQLRRTAIGQTSVSNAVDIETLVQSEDPRSFLTEPLMYLGDFPKLDVDDHLLKRFIHGQRVRVPMHSISKMDSSNQLDSTVLVRHQGELAVVAKLVGSSEEAELQPKKVLWKKG